jgi:Tol biopolymer transport system component
MDGGGAFSTFVRDFESLEPRLLADTAGTQTLFWLPDGRSLFLAVRGKLRRAPLEGNSHVVLGDSPAILLAGTPLDSERLLLTSRSESFTFAAAGGAPEPIKDRYLWPQRLPNGEILFTVRDPKLGRYRARIARFGDAAAGKDLVESSSRVLYAASSVNPGSGYLLYVRAGVLLAHPFDLRSRRLTGDAAPVANAVSYFFPGGGADFSVSDTGTLAYRPYVPRSQLVWVDRQGRQLGAIGPANISVKSARLSPDGKKIATAIYNIELGAQELWLFDSATGVGRRLDPEPAMRDVPLWSPDSNRLAYMRAVFASGTQLAMRAIAEQATEHAISPAGLQFPTDWSADGRFIAFANTPFTRFATEQQSDIWLLDLANGVEKTVPLLNTAFHEANATFSPDMKWLAFTSNQSGEAEVYVQAFDPSAPRLTGERYRVSRSGALAIRWRRDGRELFYLGVDGRVHAVPVRLASRPEFGDDTPLFEITTDARAAIHSVVGFDASADGSRFVIPIVSSPKIQPSIVVVRNWEATPPTKR